MCRHVQRRCNFFQINVTVFGLRFFKERLLLSDSPGRLAKSCPLMFVRNSKQAAKAKLMDSVNKFRRKTFGDFFLRPKHRDVFSKQLKNP